MKTTRDLHTGRPFHWNTTALYYGYKVPAQCTQRDFCTLHPSRVPLQSLRQLNPDRVIEREGQG
jgi:hypothetical protein